MVTFARRRQVFDSIEYQFPVGLENFTLPYTNSDIHKSRRVKGPEQPLLGWQVTTMCTSVGFLLLWPLLAVRLIYQQMTTTDSSAHFSLLAVPVTDCLHFRTHDIFMEQQQQHFVRAEMRKQMYVQTIICTILKLVLISRPSPLTTRSLLVMNHDYPGSLQIHAVLLKLLLPELSVDVLLLFL